MPLPYAAKRQREPEAGPLRPKQVDVEPARVVLARNARGKNRHVIHVPLDRIGEVKASPPRPGQVMGQLHDAAWRPCQVAERRRQGFLDASPARGQIPPAVGIVHGVVLPRIEGTIELKRRTVRPLGQVHDEPLGSAHRARQSQPGFPAGRPQHDDPGTGARDAGDGVRELARQDRPALSPGA